MNPEQPSNVDPNANPQPPAPAPGAQFGVPVQPAAGAASQPPVTPGVAEALGHVEQTLHPGAVTHHPVSQPAPMSTGPAGPRRKLFTRAHLIASGIVLAVIGAGVLAGILIHSKAGQAEDHSAAAFAGKGYTVTSIPLSDLAKTGSLGIDANQELLVNGQLRVNNGLVIGSSDAPTKPTQGQIYYDRTSNQLMYYNGTEFVPVATSIGGQVGTLGVANGIGVVGSNIVNTGVVTIQGLSGAVSLTAGQGISINGTTITNTGLSSVSGANGLQVNTNGGNVTISLPQNIAVNSAPTFAGLNLSGLSPNSVLGLDAANNVQAISTQTAGLCLISSATGPKFDSCTGQTAVTGLTVGANTLTGGITLTSDSSLSVTSSGNVITLKTTSGPGVTSFGGVTGAVLVSSNLTVDSGTKTLDVKVANTSGQKGIASYDGTTLTINGSGVVSTSQDISTTGTPTFAGLTLSSALSVANGGTGATSLTNHGLLVGRGTSAIASLSVGTANQCLMSGGAAADPFFATCPGGGSIAPGTTHTSGTIAMFDPSNNNQIVDSLLLQSGSTVTVNGNLTVGPSFGITGDGSNITNVNAAQLNGQAASYYLNAGNINAGILSVQYGGTGLNSIAANGILIGNGTGTPTVVTASGGGQQCLMVANAGVSAPAFGTCPGGGSIAPGTIHTSGTIAMFDPSDNNKIVDSLLTQSVSTVTVNGNLTVGSGFGITGDGTNITNVDAAKLNGQAASYYLNAGNINAGILGVQYGGTGLSTIAAHGILVGNGTAAASVVTASGGGQKCLLVNNAGVDDPVFANCPVGGDVSYGTTHTAGTLTMFDANGTDIVDSSLSQDGSGNITNAKNLTNNGDVLVSSSSSTAFKVQSAANPDVLVVDAAGKRIFVNQAPTSIADVALQVNGGIQLSTNGVALPAQDTAHNGTIYYDPNGGGAGIGKFFIIEAGTKKILCNTTDQGCGAGSNAITLQGAYDNGDGSITTADPATGTTPKNIAFNLNDTTYDGSFLVNILGTSTGKFAVQKAGADILAVTANPTPAVTVNGNISVASSFTISGDGSGITHLNVGDATTTGTLAVAHGGTGLTSFSSADGVLYAASSSSLAVTAAGNTGECLVGNGAGNAPTFQSCASASGASSGANQQLSNLSGTVAINQSLTPGTIGTIDLGSATKSFRDLYLTDFSGTHSIRITSENALGADKTIYIPNTNFTAATAEICLSTGNCAGAGGGVTASGATQYYLPVFGAGNTIVNSIASQDSGATQMTVAGRLLAGGSSLTADGLTGTSGSATGVAGVSTSGTGVKGTSSSGYGVQGQSDSGVSGIFQSSNVANTQPTLVVKRNSTATADLFQAQDATGSPVLQIAADGSLKVGGTKFTVDAASGNTAIAGTLAVTGTINSATISGGTLSGGTFSGGSVSGGTISGGTLTATAVNGLNVSANAIAVASGTTTLTVDANGTGQVSIGGVSTGNVLLGGGSASTGCTVANATGDFDCSGKINGATVSSTGINGATISGGTLSGGTFSGGSVSGGTISGGTLTATAVNGLNVGTNAIAVASGTSPLTIDANSTGQISIGATSTGDILFGGGSSSTGCTVTNATGDFTCTGKLNGATVSSTGINGATISGGTLSGGTFSGGSVSGGSLTATAVNGLNVSSTAIAVNTANTNLTVDANGTGQISIGSNSSGNILLGGGSTATGCTVANATGDFTCTGKINNATISGGTLSDTGVSGPGAFTVTSGGSGSLTLTSGSGTIILGANTLQRTAAGTTTLDLVDSSADTTFAILNSDATRKANLTVEGTINGATIAATTFNGLTIATNSITAGTANTDLSLAGNGTGKVAIGTSLQVTGSIIQPTFTDATSGTIGKYAFAPNTDTSTQSIAGLPAGVAAICTTIGNCVGTSGGGLLSSGSTKFLPIFSSDGYHLVNSLISQDDYTGVGHTPTTVGVGGNLVVTQSSSAMALKVQTASTGGQTAFSVDTANNRVVIGDADNSSGANSTLLVVDSAATANKPTGVNGGLYYDTTTNSFQFYENGAYRSLSSSLQQAYNASGTSVPKIVVNATNGGVDIQNDNTSPITGSLFAVRNKTASGQGTALFNVDSSGNVVFQNTAGTNIFTVDATNGKVGTSDSASASTSSLVIKSGNATGGGFTAGNVTIDTGTSASGSAQINIGTANAGTVTVGNTAALASTKLQAGTGGVAVSTANNGSGASGTIALTTGQGTVNSGAITITSGNSTAAGGGSGSVTIDTGSTSGGTSGSVVIGGNANTVKLKGGTGGVVVQDGGGTNALQILNTSAATVARIDGSGNIYSTSNISAAGVTSGASLLVSDAANGSIQRIFTQTGTSNNDVVIYDSTLDKVVETTTARDRRVVGVMKDTVTGTVVTEGTATVKVDTGAVSVGDQLVTSITAGMATVDNNATTGILGTAITAKAAGSTGTVTVKVRPVAGQYSPVFRNATDSSTAFQIQNASGTSFLTADSTHLGVTIGDSSARSSFSTSTINTNSGPDAVATGDFNGDGKTDAIVANFNGNNALVYINSGSGLPTNATTTLTTGTGPYAVATGDFNGDGKTDAIVANFSQNNASVFINTGSALPTSATSTLTGLSSPWGIATGDFNGDSKTDVIVTNSNLTTASVFLNTGSALSTSVSSTITVGTSPYGVATGDFNGDGKTDALVANYGSTSVSVLINTGSALPTSATTTISTGASTNPYHVATGDFNGDGKTDAIVTNFGFSGASNAFVYINTGSALPTSATSTLTTGTNPAFVATGDLNGDGKTDAAIANYGSNNASVYLNTGSALPTSATSTLTADVNPRGVATGDFSADGKTDMIVTNYGSSPAKATIFTNITWNPSLTTYGTATFSISNTAAFQIQNANGNNLLTADTTNMALAVNGATTIKPLTDSTTAFQVQNANGSQIFNVDTKQANVTIGAGTADITAWTLNSNNLCGSFSSTAGATINGYAYAVDTSGGTKNVCYAKVNGDGTVGTWASTTLLPVTRNGASVAAANGYLYVVGGNSNTTYYAKANPDGTLGSWNLATPTLAQNKWGASTVVANGYLYEIGGALSNSSYPSDTNTYSAKLYPDGSIGSWTTGGTIPVAQSGTGAFVANGYAYMVGGFTSGGISSQTVYYAKLNTDGTTGSWTTTTSFPVTSTNHVSVVANGYVYVYGSNATTSVYYAKINSAGTLGSWQTSANSLSQIQYSGTGLNVNGYLYLIGGSSSNRVIYASTPRLKVGTSLDLVGSESGDLSSEGGIGGSLTAGNTRIAGTLDVTGAANFTQGISVGGHLSLAGALAISNTSTTLPDIQLANGKIQAAASTNNVSIQNSAGSAVLNVDTKYSNITLNNRNGDIVPATGTTNWNTTTATLSCRQGHTSVTYNGYVYALGGSVPATCGTPGAMSSAYSTGVSTTEYARLNADGTIASTSYGTWQNTSSFPSARYQHSTVVSSGYVYVIGGLDTSGNATSTVYYAKIKADGTLGAWSTASNGISDGATSQARFGHTSVVANGRLYVIGGSSGSAASPTLQNTVLYASINADGSLGTWASTTGINNTSTPLAYHSSVMVNGYLYVIGGCSAVASTGCTTDVSTTYRAKINADGTITAASWNQGAAISAGTLHYATATVMNGYLYLVGGERNTTAVTGTSYAQINSDGSLSSWATATPAFSSGLRRHAAAAYNGYLYEIGGYTGAGAVATTVQYGSTERISVAGSLDLVGVTGNDNAEGGAGGMLTAGNTNVVGTLDVTGEASFMQNVSINGNLNVNSQVAFKNNTNSTTAFQVQNAAGQTIVNVDTINNAISVNGSSGEISGWGTTQALPVGRKNAATVTANGYAYIIGGNNGTTAQATVFYAKINADGTMGSWSCQGADSTVCGGTPVNSNYLPAVRDTVTATASNGYIYVLGGSSSSTVYYAKLNGDGSTGAWTATSSMPTVRNFGGSFTANGYLYYAAGEDASSSAKNTIFYAKFNADGSVGTWQCQGASNASTSCNITPTNSNYLPATRTAPAVTVANGYAYVTGGYSGGAQSTTYYAKLNSDGSTGAWSTSANSFPGAVGRYLHTATVVNNNLYVVGGSDGTTTQSTVFYSQLGSNGAPGVWSTSAASPALSARKQAATITLNGYIYVVGGDNGGIQTSTQYASTARLKVGGSLDLLAYSGGNETDGPTGGSLTAGNTRVVGSLDVLGQANFVQGVAIAGNFNVSGPTAFRNSTDSTTTFQIQNSSAQALLNVDTVNSTLTVNGGTGGAINSWQTATGTGFTASESHQTVTMNGYVYVFGGFNAGGTGVTTVQYAKLLANGNVGTWSTTTALPAAIDHPGVATYNGYIYITGGATNETATNARNTVYYIDANADGTLDSGGWKTGSPIVVSSTQYKRWKPSSLVANGYLYVIGGTDTTNAAQVDVLYSKLNADGSNGTWATATSLNTAAAFPTAAAANGYVYVVGGATTTVQYAKINSNGTLGTWTVGTSLPQARAGAAGGVTNGYLYAYGGNNGGTYYSNTFFAKLNSDGSVGSWSCQGASAQCSATTPVNSVAIPGNGRTDMGVGVIANGYLYALGGWDGSVAQGTVYYASIARLVVNSALDLVGNSGASLTDENGSGGSLTAGNTRVVGSLDVQGQANFAQNVAIGGNLNVSGDFALTGKLTLGTLTSGVADSASAVAFTFNTSVSYATTGDKLLSVQNNGSEKFAIDRLGNISLSGHIISGGTAPTGSVNATNAGAGATCTISGNDTAGLITIVTAAGTHTSGNMCTVTFASAFSQTPRITLTPGNGNAAGMNVYSDSSANTASAFDLSFGQAPLSGANTYTIYYHILQ